MSFDHETKSQIWHKATEVRSYDPNRWRKDACGAWIGWTEYGDRDSDYGWEIDHIDPNGGDDLSNLRPLQWKNNVATSDSGVLTRAVTASGDRNVDSD